MYTCHSPVLHHLQFKGLWWELFILWSQWASNTLLSFIISEVSFSPPVCNEVLASWQNSGSQFLNVQEMLSSHISSTLASTGGTSPYLLSSLEINPISKSQIWYPLYQLLCRFYFISTIFQILCHTLRTQWKIHHEFCPTRLQPFFHLFYFSLPIEGNCHLLISSSHLMLIILHSMVSFCITWLTLSISEINNTTNKGPGPPSMPNC